jgi:hypothetical protein
MFAAYSDMCPVSPAASYQLTAFFCLLTGETE